MSLSKKIAPRVSDPELQRIVERLYQDINEVIEAMAGSQKGDPVESSGRVSDMKIVQDGANSYHLAVKTTEGWVNMADGSLTLAG